jgi:hypothetical protein
VIPVVFIAIGAAAAAGALYRAVRRGKKKEAGPVARATDEGSDDGEANAEAKRVSNKKVEAAKKPGPVPVDPLAPLGVGDVVVLDGGRGAELWLVRSLTLCESAADPFLVVFEADGPAGKRALVAHAPAAEGRVQILWPHSLAEASMLEGTRTSRPPSTLDVTVEGCAETLKLDMRRAARGSLVEAPRQDNDVDTGTALPPVTEGGSILVAAYSGGAKACALVLRAEDGKVHAYVGESVRLDTVSVLRNR